MWVLFWLSGCTLEGTRVTLSFTSPDGVPEGTAQLTRRDTPGDVRANGFVAVPAVAAADHGEVKFDDLVVLGAPDGAIIYDLSGFDPTERCEGIFPPGQQEQCYPWGWSGSLFLHVGDYWDSEDEWPNFTQLASGVDSRVEIEVVEDCYCNE